MKKSRERKIASQKRETGSKSNKWQRTKRTHRMNRCCSEVSSEEEHLMPPREKHRGVRLTPLPPLKELIERGFSNTPIAQQNNNNLD